MIKLEKMLLNAYDPGKQLKMSFLNKIAGSGNRADLISIKHDIEKNRFLAKVMVKDTQEAPEKILESDFLEFLPADPNTKNVKNLNQQNFRKLHILDQDFSYRTFEKENCPNSSI